jgi:hypothetical protein
VVWISGAITLISGLAYMAEGLRLLKDGGHTVPAAPANPNKS